MIARLALTVTDYNWKRGDRLEQHVARYALEYGPAFHNGTYNIGITEML